MLMAIGGILLFVAGVLGLVILVNAFKESVGQGLLCMFVPLYIFYFAFARYKSPKKGLVVGSYVGAGLVGAILMSVGAVQTTTAAAKDFEAALDEEIQKELEEGTTPPAAATASADEGGEQELKGSCDMDHNGQCVEYYSELAAGPGEAACSGEWSQDSCATDGVVANCDKQSEKTFYYDDAGETAQLKEACETFGGTFVEGG